MHSIDFYRNTAHTGLTNYHTLHERANWHLTEEELSF